MKKKHIQTLHYIHFMKAAFLALAFVCGFSALAQQNPNYDPDWNGDGVYGVADLMGFLSLFGSSAGGSSSGDYQLYDIGPAGGFIFFVDIEDDFADWDYLEAAPITLSSYNWGDWGCYIPGADEQALGFGLQNTIDLVARFDSCQTDAAMAAWDYEVAGFSDWFLPSLAELQEMHDVLHLNGLGLFGESLHASSSDATNAENNSCWYIRFEDGAALGWGRGTSLVRPIRRF